MAGKREKKRNLWLEDPGQFCNRQPHCSYGNAGSERGRDFPKVTQQGAGQSRDWNSDLSVTEASPWVLHSSFQNTAGPIVGTAWVSSFH